MDIGGYMASGMGSPMSDSIRIRRVQNGFIVDMFIEEEEDYGDSPEGKVSEAMLKKLQESINTSDDIMDGIKASYAHNEFTLKGVAKRKVRRPVTIICTSLDDVLSRVSEHFGWKPGR